MNLNHRGWRMDGVMRESYRKACGYPLRQAVRWTEAEDLQAMAAFDMGASFEDIAADHQRPIGGVTGRIKWMLERRGQGFPPSPRTTADQQPRHCKHHSNKARCNMPENENAKQPRASRLSSGPW